MKQPLAIVRGRTETLWLTITDATGAQYTLQNGEIIRFGIKRRPDDNSYVVLHDINSSSLSNGAYQINISPGDTEDLPFGQYFYDIGLQSGSDYFDIIECSEFRIAQNVTRRSAT